MVSDSSCNSSDDESRNNKVSRKRRRGSHRENNHSNRENNRRSDGARHDRRNQFHKNNIRQERKRRLETSPPRREDHHGRHRQEEGGSKRSKDDYNQNRQRDFRDKKQNKNSFEKARVKKEPSPEWGKLNIKKEEKPKPQVKEKPNFGLSGKLTEETNTVNGVVIKYAEPDDAMKPKRRWRFYPFKGEKTLPTLYIHRQSAFLMGRDRKIADIPLDHPSCSKQHAALQYRLVPYSREDGSQGRRVRPYLIDLESANGTFVNDVKLEPRRYHELLERDVIRFGFSSREYVLLHEKSKDEEQDDDVPADSK